MRKTLLSCVCALMFMPQIIASVTFVYNGLNYIVNSDGTTVSVCYNNEVSGVCIIPKTAEYESETYKVTSIGDAAFMGCRGLLSVEIPNSVITIGEGAFSHCIGLTSIVIPNSVRSIGSFAFNGCTGLTSIELPNSVTSIGSYIFAGCTGVASVTNLGGVTEIGEYAFQGCTGLTSIKIPDNIKSIGNFAFEGCSELTSIELPSSVTSIKHNAFNECVSLATITVDNDNPVLDSRDNCNAIIESSSSTLILGCKTTRIPNSVKVIGGYAFYKCIGLTSIEIPNGIISIGEGAFLGCTGLTSINIPKSVISVGGAAFSGYTNITSISVDKNNSVYDSRDNCNAIIETVTNKLVAGCRNTKIPSSVTSIGFAALNGCTSLTSIEIPNGITSIENEAFAFCIGLTSLSLPSSVISIGEYAFCACSSLKSVEINGSQTIIGRKAFIACGFTSITSMIEDPSDATEFFDEGFDYSRCKLYVPCNTLDAYEATAGWNRFYSIECIEAKHIDEPLDDVVITPSSTNVVIAWPVVDNADSYVIEIKSGSKTVCVLIFNGEGQLLSVEYPSASERMAEARDASAAYGYQYSIASLTPGTEYSYTIEALDDSERILSIKSGSFITDDEPVSADAQSAEPEFKNKVYVQDKNIIVEGLSAEEYSIYNTAGKQVGNPVPASGVYVVKVGDEAVKVMVK